MEPNYEGQFIFIEARGLDSDGNLKSTYYNGEYLCLRDSGTMLYCCKPDGGYESHTLRTFHKIGSDQYKVINARTDRNEMQMLAEDLERFSQPPVKPHWNPSVYASAATRAKEIHRLLGQRQAIEYVSVNIAEVVVNGVRYIPA